MANTRHNLGPKERARSNKTKVIPFRGTSAEKAKLEELAAADGMTLSDYIRTALRLKSVRRRKRPQQVELLEAARAVTGIGRNLNQLTKNAHERREYPPQEIIDGWSEQLEDLRPQLEMLQAYALGEDLSEMASSDGQISDTGRVAD